MSYNLHGLQLLTFHENNPCNLAFAETIFHISSSRLRGRFGKWIRFCHMAAFHNPDSLVLIFMHWMFRRTFGLNCILGQAAFFCLM